MTLQCDLAEPCDPRVRCTNLNPGFRCDPCPPGYTGSAGVEGIGLEEAYRNRQQCYDIDECNDGKNGGCTPNSICNNVEVFVGVQKLWKVISPHAEEYLNLRGRKWQEAGEDHIMQGFITCLLHQMLLE